MTVRRIKTEASSCAGVMRSAMLTAAAVLAVFVLSCSSVRAKISYADAVYINEETGYGVYIDDGRDLLTDEEELALIEDMKPVTAYGNAAFVSDAQYGDTKTFAANLYQSYFGTDSGTLFLIDMGARNIWIHSNGAVYRTVTTPYANTITDNVYRYASRGEYYACAAEAFSQISTLLAGGRISQPMRWITNALLAVIVSLLINFLLVRYKGRNVRPARKELIAATIVGLAATGLSMHLTNQTKRYSPRSSGSGGGGGGFSGGGGGGGGSHGGGGGHSF